VLRRWYVQFFIDITTREVILGGITTNPTGAWSVQAARNLFLVHSDRLANAKALVRDRGSQFTIAFDEVFRTEGMTILKTPVRTPVANSVAERWIGSMRRELLDRTIIWNQRQRRRPRRSGEGRRGRDVGQSAAYTSISTAPVLPPVVVTASNRSRWPVTATTTGGAGSVPASKGPSVF